VNVCVCVCIARAQRRPIIDFELKQLPHAFTCVMPSSDPNVIALGDTHGNVVEIDLRNKNIKGLFRGAAPPPLRVARVCRFGSLTRSLLRRLCVVAQVSPARCVRSPMDPMASPS
jgi:hypothetical protein